MLTVKQIDEQTWEAAYTDPSGLWNVCIHAPDEVTANKWIKVEIVEEAKEGLKRHKRYVAAFKAAIRVAKPWWRFW